MASSQGEKIFSFVLKLFYFLASGFPLTRTEKGRVRQYSSPYSKGITGISMPFLARDSFTSATFFLGISR